MKYKLYMIQVYAAVYSVWHGMQWSKEKRVAEKNAITRHVHNTVALSIVSVYAGCVS